MQDSSSSEDLNSAIVQAQPMLASSCKIIDSGDDEEMTESSVTQQVYEDKDLEKHASPLDDTRIPMVQSLSSLSSVPIVQAQPLPFQERWRNPHLINESNLWKLTEHGYTHGLAKSFERSKEAYALRIWLIDNSSSMLKTDGHRLVETTEGDVKLFPCSRWDEIRQCVSYHINLASTIGAPTRFRLLNDPGAHVGPQQFSVAEIAGFSPYDAKEARRIMRLARPGGCTPLTSHMLDIYDEVSVIAPHLVRSGKRASVTIVTDSLPTDESGYGGYMIRQQFIASLRRLEGLPISFIFRLCTKEKYVVSFYNELKSTLKLPVQIRGDICQEAQKVHAQNPWLNYSLPIHCLREMGYHDSLFDILGERRLTECELRDFCALVFGRDAFDDIPDPSADLNGFIKTVEFLQLNEKQTWDPIKKRIRPFFDTSSLYWSYGKQKFMHHLQTLRESFGYMLCNAYS